MRLFVGFGMDRAAARLLAAKVARLKVLEDRLARAVARRGVVAKDGAVRGAVTQLESVIRRQVEIIQYAADPERGRWHLEAERNETDDEKGAES
jgi:hypothetical protein